MRTQYWAVQWKEEGEEEWRPLCGVRVKKRDAQEEMTTLRAFGHDARVVRVKVEVVE